MVSLQPRGFPTLAGYADVLSFPIWKLKLVHLYLPCPLLATVRTSLYEMVRRELGPVHCHPCRQTTPTQGQASLGPQKLAACVQGPV